LTASNLEPKGKTMSFQAYINNIKAKTGKGPDDFRKLAEQRGFFEKGQIKQGVKAGEVVKWAKENFGLGHGHAMAIYALLKGIKRESVDESRHQGSARKSKSETRS
jgi:Domain of unknown function (DUF4287)